MSKKTLGGLLVVLFVGLGGIGAAYSATPEGNDDGAAVASPSGDAPVAGKASRTILNAAADILHVSSTDRENALAGRCGQISDGQYRLVCQNDCGNISNSDVRNLCKHDCGAISNSELRQLCQGG